jgi:NifU-like protein involved in Fe-S cluster formation
MSKKQSVRFMNQPKNVEWLLSKFQVIDHYENPRNVGSLDKADKRVGTGLVGAPACGDVMKLQIKVTTYIYWNNKTNPRLQHYYNIVL